MAESCLDVSRKEGDTIRTCSYEENFKSRQIVSNGRPGSCFSSCLLKTPKMPGPTWIRHGSMEWMRSEVAGTDSPQSPNHHNNNRNSFDTLN